LTTSGFIGFAMMIVTFPIPAWIAKLMGNVQGTKMAAVRSLLPEFDLKLMFTGSQTDARMKMISEREYTFLPIEPHILPISQLR
jgi:hypothetical protein